MWAKCYNITFLIPANDSMKMQHLQAPLFATLTVGLSWCSIAVFCSCLVGWKRMLVIHLTLNL